MPMRIVFREKKKMMNFGRRQKTEKHVFGARMRNERIRRGLTQQTVADAVHISQSTLSRIEHGDTSPDPELRTALLEYFGLAGQSRTACGPAAYGACADRICISRTEAEWFFYSGLIVLSFAMREFGPFFALAAFFHAYRCGYRRPVIVMSLVWAVLLTAVVSAIYVYPLLVLRGGI